MVSTVTAKKKKQKKEEESQTMSEYNFFERPILVDFRCTFKDLSSFCNSVKSACHEKGIGDASVTFLLLYKQQD